MLELINIEFYKLRNTRYFWVLSGLFILFLISVPIGVYSFLEYLTAQGENIFDFDLAPNELPFFDFVDIWQNFTWIYKGFSAFLAFIIVISICNEFSYGTIKQNIIDGLSREQFLWSKIGFIVAQALGVSLAVTIILMVSGLLLSPVQGGSFMLDNIEFVGGYFLHLIGYQLFAMFLALLIKRSGIVISILILYTYVVEFIFGNLLDYNWDMTWLANLLPVRAIGNIIPFPYGKYALRESQNYIGMDDLGILIGYIFLLGGLCYWLITRH
jgi:ABC-type transport system involved in multi-copper enzyme maturation permease subunit